MPRSTPTAPPPEPEDKDFTPEGGVTLYDRQGQEHTVHTRVEYTSLVYGEGYTLTKPEDPAAEPEVPTPVQSGAPAPPS